MQPATTSHQASVSSSGYFLAGGGSNFALSRRSAAVVAVYAGVLLLIGLGGGTRVLTYHEVLFAQPAKEMLATGNWILPKFGDFPSTHKPPGAHWAIALIMGLTGSEAEGIVRIPSALAGIAAALLVAWLAARWFGDRVGLVAGLVQATMYYTMQLGRLAECDMLLTLAVTAAMGAFAVAHVDGPRGIVTARWLPWLFYACVTWAYFCKGLIGLAFIFTGCGVYTILHRDRRALRFLLNPLGVCGFLLLTLAWFWAAYTQYPQFLDDQITHHFARFQGRMGGRKDPLFYLYSPALITLPWTPLVIWGVVQGVRRGLHLLPWWRFAACWTIPGWLLLNFSSFKSKHYAAPLMPPLSIIAALVLLAWLRRGTQWSSRVLVAGLLAGGVVCALGAMAIMRFLPLPSAECQWLAILLVLGSLCLAAVVWCQSSGRKQFALVASFGTAALAVLVATTQIMPHHDSYRGQAEFAAAVNRLVPEGEACCLLDLEENQITYYLRNPLRRFISMTEFREEICTEHQVCYVLAAQAAYKDLIRDFEIEELGAVPERAKRPADEALALYRLTLLPELARMPPLKVNEDWK